MICEAIGSVTSLDFDTRGRDVEGAGVFDLLYENLSHCKAAVFCVNGKHIGVPAFCPPSLGYAGDISS